MSIFGIQGQILEVTVVGCNKLKDTEWISRQDPYVCVEYGSTKFRTRTCTDGGKNPTFQEKFVFTLIQGLRELNIGVWNSNTLSSDDFIGNGKAQLQKVLSQGFDDSPWPVQTKTGRYAGEVRLIMHYSNANTNHHPTAPPYAPQYSAPPYAAPPPAAHYPPPPPASHYPPPPPASHYPPPPPASHYPPPPSGYPPSAPYPAYPPTPSAYGPPPPGGGYPPSPYPPPPSSYYPPQGPYPGIYPPPY